MDTTLIVIICKGPNDILFTEKDAGTVRRVVNGTELQQPLLNLSVATYAHRGLLGIAVVPLTTVASSNHGIRNNITYVFLYYTQAQTILVTILQKENNHWVIAYTGMSCQTIS